jgi:membrane-associated protein
MTETLQFIRESELACALLIFSIAFGEAFILSSFLLPGTLLTIGFGGLVRTGALPPWIVLATWAGTFLGDVCSYFLARRVGGWLRKIRRLSPMLDRGETAFSRRPIFFALASRFSPYLKSTAPTLAGLSRFPIAAFLLVNILASGLDAAFFLGLGYIGTAVAVEADATNRVASFIGLVVVCAIVYLLVRECLRNPASCRRARCRQRKKRGFLFKLRCLFFLVPWNVCGWVEEWLNFWNRKCIRRMALRCLSHAEVGDIVLLARAYAPPWGGIWTHAALVTSSEGAGLVIHAYEGRVVEESYGSLPKRCRMALIRVRANADLIERAVVEARKQLGKRFSLAAGKPKTATPNTFNCAGLISFSFARAGCDLAPVVEGLVIPQDLADSGFVKVVCDFQCPDLSSQNGGVAPVATWPAHVSRLCVRFVAILRTRRAGRIIARFFQP